MMVHDYYNGKLPARHSHFLAEPWKAQGRRYCKEKTKMILEQM
jgi:hypothetical protein